MRWSVLCLAAVLTVAVTGSLRGDLHERHRAAVAFAFARASSPSDDSKPDVPGSPCRNCEGTGKVGDGRVMTECPVCGGTGKTPSSRTDHGAALADPASAPQSVLPGPSPATADDPNKYLVLTEVTKTVNYLVTLPNCQPCRRMKADLQSKGIPFTEISLSEAAAMGHQFSGAPQFFSEPTTTTYLQPPWYRRQSRAEVTLNGSHYPTKSAMLNHLRNAKPHQGKHWQEWHLETWDREQLIALHDDDHAGTVPVFERPREGATPATDGPPSDAMERPKP